MKKTTVTHIIIANIILVFFLWGCGTDNSPVSPGSGDGDESYTISLSIEPSTAYRTAGTANLWTEPVVTEFHSSFTAEHQDDGHSDDDHGDETHHGDIFIGTTTIDDMMIVITADHAADMFHIYHGHNDGDEHSGMEFEKEHAVEGDYMLEVHLYVEHHEGEGDTHQDDALNGRIIGYSDIHIITHDKDSNEIKIPLLPVLTEHGFRYASNTALSPGTYDLHVEIGAPEFSRLAGFEQKWNDNIEFEFHDFSFDAALADEIEIGSAEISGLHYTLEANKVSSFTEIGVGELSLTGDETIQFLLKVADESIQADDYDILYSSITVHITNNDSGESTEKALHAVYGDHGFHYAVNISLPEGHGQDDTTDDHNEEEEPNGH